MLFSGAKKESAARREVIEPVWGIFGRERVSAWVGAEKVVAEIAGER
jgi:hypothetical protein